LGGGSKFLECSRNPTTRVQILQATQFTKKESSRTKQTLSQIRVHTHLIWLLPPSFSSLILLHIMPWVNLNLIPVSDNHPSSFPFHRGKNFPPRIRLLPPSLSFPNYLLIPTFIYIPLSTCQLTLISRKSRCKNPC